MFYAYVIRSKSFNRLYKGACHDIDVRIKEHNAGKTKSTKPFIPWEVVYYETFNTFLEARKR
ncbi:MAG: GIY-YIG nuclease family protein, partial [Cyclobacteriaceae bacterium]